MKSIRKIPEKIINNNIHKMKFNLYKVLQINVFKMTRAGPRIHNNQLRALIGDLINPKK